jgi:hypothetical protein
VIANYTISRAGDEKGNSFYKERRRETLIKIQDLSEEELQARLAAMEAAVRQVEKRIPSGTGILKSSFEPEPLPPEPEVAPPVVIQDVPSLRMGATPPPEYEEHIDMLDEVAEVEEKPEPKKRKAYYNRLPVSYRPEQIEAVREHVNTTGKALRAWVWEAIEEKMYNDYEPQIDPVEDLAEDETPEERQEEPKKERRFFKWGKDTKKK